MEEVVNKQSNLITVTSYTPFRHQREREEGLVKMFEPQQLFVRVAWGLGRARSDWGDIPRVSGPQTPD